MITADYHVHTSFSPDSNTSPEQMIQSAIANGLTHLCFTDHMDYNYPTDDGTVFEFDPDAYFETLEYLKENYQSRIKLLIGVELGLQSALAPRLKALTSAYPFDFVIGSSHMVEAYDPYDSAYWDGISAEEGIEKYYRSILENISACSDFDVYGHIDYITRYIPEDKKNPYVLSYESFALLLDDILREIIRHGKAIEVNTGGYRYNPLQPNPHERIIARYISLGGKHITIGSDAHKPEYVAYRFETVRKKLLSLGIHEYTVFENRIPTQIAL